MTTKFRGLVHQLWDIYERKINAQKSILINRTQPLTLVFSVSWLHLKILSIH